MKSLLIVVDMQKDFVDGALGTAEAVAIVPYVKEVIESFDGKIFFTRDTHFENYLETEDDTSLNTICLGHILKDYFEKAKNEYNTIEEDLGLLL